MSTSFAICNLTQINNVFAKYSTFANKSLKCLTPDGYRLSIIELFGYDPHDWEVEQIFHDLPDQMDFEQFKKIIERKLKYHDSERYVREMFSTLDAEWKGYITAEDMKTAAKMISPVLSTAAVVDAFREICTADGKLFFGEFRHIMLYNLC